MTDSNTAAATFGVSYVDLLTKQTSILTIDLTILPKEKIKYACLIPPMNFCFCGLESND